MWDIFLIFLAAFVPLLCLAWYLGGKETEPFGIPDWDKLDYGTPAIDEGEPDKRLKGEL